MIRDLFLHPGFKSLVMSHYKPINTLNPKNGHQKISDKMTIQKVLYKILYRTFCIAISVPKKWSGYRRLNG